jgi:hypothetical protein
LQPSRTKPRPFDRIRDRVRKQRSALARQNRAG